MTDARSGHRTAALAVAGVAVLALAACSPLRTDELPPTADAPWICPGVSRDSVALVTGEGYLVTQLGDWRHLEREPFRCEVNASSGNVIIQVERLGEGTEAQQRAGETVDGWTGGDALPNTLGVPGSGYRWGEPGDLVTAQWVCGERRATVELDTVWLDGTRDQRADAATLLYQLLPFACGNAAVPDVDYSPEPSV